MNVIAIRGKFENVKRSHKKSKNRRRPSVKHYTRNFPSSIHHVWMPRTVNFIFHPVD